MHPTAYKSMEKFAGMLPKDKPLKIADVGSFDVNGSFRPLFTRPGWTYTGIDICPGSNVDIVVPESGWMAIPAGSYDAVISGSTLEHTRRPWVFMCDCARILKPGGLICVNAPYNWAFHEHPIDCWRVFPDGMRAVMEWAGLEVMETWKQQCWPDGQGDTTGIARKPVAGKPPAQAK